MGAAQALTEAGIISDRQAVFEVLRGRGRKGHAGKRGQLRRQAVYFPLQPEACRRRTLLPQRVVCRAVLPWVPLLLLDQQGRMRRAGGERLTSAGHPESAEERLQGCVAGG